MPRGERPGGETFLTMVGAAGELPAATKPEIEIGDFAGFIG